MNKQKVNMTSSTKEKGYSSSSHYRISSEFEQSEQALATKFVHCIDQKIFHAEIVVDVAKVSAETKAYKPIPMIADFTNENGSDSLRETTEANYRQVKQEVLSLVDTEIERIKADPKLCHLIKE